MKFVPPAPAYLAAALRERFDELAPDLTQMGVLTRLDADALAKYVVAEHEYLRVTSRAMAAINSGDPTEAERWISVQDRLLRQCLTAGAEFGLTPSGRRSRGLPAPKG